MKQLLAQVARAELWVDKPPFGDWNSKLEVERFQFAAQPYYVVLDPRDDSVLETKDGYDPDPAIFAAFLQSALTRYAERTPSAMPAGGAWHERNPFPADREQFHVIWIVSMAILAGVVGLLLWLIVALVRQERSKRREDAELAAA